MPGYDRSGPQGLGPRTGWGRGYCSGNAPAEAYGPSGFGFRGGFGRGGGRSFGFRNGGGFGFRRGYGPGYNPYPVSAEEEKRILEQQKADAENEAKAIEQRLKSLENNQNTGE